MSQIDLPIGTRFVNLIGHRYGRLLVVEYAGRDRRRTFFKCQCDCGNSKIVASTHLRQGYTKSCGCFHLESARRAKKHGLSNASVFHIWQSMKQRCYDPHHSNYRHYGGRGIGVCDRWKDSFENFHADMGNRPNGFSLDRINVNGNYEPGNCRWATRKQQAQNTTANIRITYNGETMVLMEWARRLGVRHQTLYNRHRWGWTPEEILNTPVKLGRKRPSFRGLSRSHIKDAVGKIRR